MYALEPNNFGNPRFYYITNLGTWSSFNLVNAAGDIYARYIGVLGTNDVFLQEIVSSVPRYYHWAGNLTSDAPLETTNIPDGERLMHIDCRAGVGCYAGGGTSLWRTPGDRNAWAKVPDAVDIGTIGGIWIGSSTFILVAGTQGRIARYDGTGWTVHQLSTSAPVAMLVGASTTDAFALTRSPVDEHQLFHWNGKTWSRVRTPVPAVGSNVEQLWTGGRITYFGGPGYFYALTRTEPW